MSEIPQAAIDAATVAVEALIIPTTGHPTLVARKRARAAIEAALPHLDAHLREQIVQECIAAVESSNVRSADRPELWSLSGGLALDALRSLLPSAAPTDETPTVRREITCGTCAGSGWIGSRRGEYHRHCPSCSLDCAVCPAPAVQSDGTGQCSGPDYSRVFTHYGAVEPGSVGPCETCPMDGTCPLVAPTVDSERNGQ